MAVQELQKSGMSRGAIVRDVLPWADPYVAQLIKNLQDEVRMERSEKSPRLQGRNRIAGYKVSAA